MIRFRRRTLAVKAGAFFFGVLMALVLGELLLRVAGWSQGIDYRRYLVEVKNADRLPPAIFHPKASAARLMRPNASGLSATSDFTVEYSINSKGVRDREYTYDRPLGVTRFVALGDSFTFGEGVPYGKRFTDIPEEKLDDIEIINMGVPGIGIYQELLQFMFEGRKYRPDYVLLFLNYYDTDRHGAHIYRDGHLHVPSGPGKDRSQWSSIGSDTALLERKDPLYASSPHFLTKQSALLSYVRYHYELFRLRSRLQEDAERLWKKPTSHRLDFSSDLAADPDEHRKQSTLDILNRLAEECRKIGAQLIIVNIEQLKSLRYVESVDNAIYFDLSSELNRLGQTRNIRFKYDGHYNPETHAFIGNKLTSFLRTRILSNP